MLGVAVGIGTLVATVGLATTAAAQIDSEFNALLSTLVGVGAVADGGPSTIDTGATTTSAVNSADLTGPHTGTTREDAFPPDAIRRVAQITGVVCATLWYTIDPNASFTTSIIAARLGEVTPARLVAGDENFARTEELSIAGRTDLGVGPTAWLGAGLADHLGITAEQLPIDILISGVPTAVVGIITDAPTAPSLLSSAVISVRSAQERYGNLGRSDMTMLIRTRPGAAYVVAHLAPLAIRPDNPTALAASAPPEPTHLRNQVNTSLNQLLLGLAAVALLVGALGIANMTLVSVLERVAEIGLRRAVGATRLAVATQFIAESGTLGFLGGIVGGCAGLIVVVAVSAAHTWTVTLPAGLPLLGPALGLLVGIAAGGYPAYRASRIPPAQALRR